MTEITAVPEVVEVDNWSFITDNGIGAAVDFTSGFESVIGESTSKKPKAVSAPAQTSSSGSKPWFPWGESNDFPQRVIEDVGKSTVASGALNLTTNMLYGAGIITYKWEYTEGGKRVKRLVKDPDFAQFSRRNRLKVTHGEILQDFKWFANGFVELVLSEDRKKINRIFPLQTAFTRLELMDNTGRIRNIYYSADFPDAKPEDCKKIPFIDIRYPFESIEQGKGHNFVYPVFSRYPGRSYYHEAIWNSARNSGWMRIAGKVPALKEAIYKHQLVIKYHIQVSEDYWKSKYADWAKIRSDEVLFKKARKDLQDEIKNCLSGESNAGKFLMSGFGLNPRTGEQVDGIKITQIEGKKFDGAFLPDVHQADAQILFAHNANPGIIGVNPSGKESGSGSNIREGISAMQATNFLDRERCLDYLNFIRDFNGWDEDLEISHADIDISQTLDQNPTGSSAQAKGA